MPRTTCILCRVADWPRSRGGREGGAGGWDLLQACVSCANLLHVDVSDASKSKRRRHSQTLSKPDKERSSHSSSAGGSGRRGRVAVTETISSEDYFKRSAEFRKWLTEKVKAMHSLSSLARA